MRDAFDNFLPFRTKQRLSENKLPKRSQSMHLLESMIADIFRMSIVKINTCVRIRYMTYVELTLDYCYNFLGKQESGRSLQ